MPRVRQPKISRANSASVEVVLGAAGSGKTSYVMGELRRIKPARLMVWDTKGEFAAEGYAAPVETLGEVVKIVAGAGKAGAFAIAYRPRGDDKQMRAQFDIFCRLAYEAKRLTLVAEELSDVTMAAWAPAGWRKASSQGRTEGLTIYGLSQHPASIDKHFFGNASKVRTGRLNFAAHVRTVANILQVPQDEIIALAPLDWIERDLNTGAMSRGRLTF